MLVYYEIVATRLDAMLKREGVPDDTIRTCHDLYQVALENMGTLIEGHGKFDIHCLVHHVNTLSGVDEVMQDIPLDINQIG